MLLAPLIHIVALELARPQLLGPTASAIRLNEIYGVLAFVLGRGLYGLVAIIPMILGAYLGVVLARELIGSPPPSRKDAAVKAVDAQNAKAGAQRDTTEQARVAERAARAAYHELVQGVRALFGPNAPQRKALDVSGKPTVAATDFLAAATTLFNNALELGDIGATLAQYAKFARTALRGRPDLLHALGLGPQRKAAATQRAA